MTDPFSVGTGVVGVLSLGITVCQGLAAYYGPFTQFDSETKALVQKAEGLTSTLKQLESLLKPFQNPLNSPPDEVHLVTQRIKDCQGELERLSHALTKCRGCDATTVIEKSGWYYARKALYPFKRGSLISLTGTVSNLQSNLDTALLVLNLAFSKRLQDQTTLTLSVSKSIAAGATDISTTLTRIEHRQQKIFQAIQSFQQAGATSPRALPPATLQSLCDQQQHVNRQLRKHAPPGHAPKSKSASCTCPPEAPRRWKFFPKFQSHRFGCPLYFQGEEITLFRRRYAFCNRFLGLSIQLSMNATSGAGGFSIHPLFDVRRVVPRDAPAFKLIDEIFSNPYEALGGYSLNSFLLRMQRLFEDGEASPRDTLSDGTTILHHAVNGLEFCFFSDEIVQSYLEMVETLALVCHVPINEMQTRHGKAYTALDLLFDISLKIFRVLQNIEHFTTLISNLLANDGDITKLPCLRNPGYPLRNAAHFFLPRVVNELCTQDIELSDLEVSILKRSEEDVKSFLEHNNTEDIKVKDAVFLSMMEWPAGLDLILKSSISHHERDIKLMLAVSSLQKKSVGLLLAAGWPVSCISLYEAARLSDNMEIFRMVTDVLAKRRRHLLTSARERLNLSQLTLHADMDDISMKNTKTIYKMLKESIRGIHEAIFIDAVEIFPVYEYIGYNREAADILYEAGFTNVEEERSPIRRLNTPYDDELCDYLDVCYWFQTKGASFYSQFLGVSTLPIHHIARHVGKWLDRYVRCERRCQTYKMAKSALSHQRALLKDVLADTEHHDSCSCACSVGGCLPSTILIAEATQYLDFWSSDDATAKLFDFLNSVTTEKLKEMHDILAPVVLRLFTFKELQISHTCRDHIVRTFADDDTWGKVKISDVPEVQAEERHLIDHLDKLVTEFEGKYKELNVLLPEFLCGYWRDRMNEVKAEEESFDEQEARRMREVGVIVECPSSVSE